MKRRVPVALIPVVLIAGFTGASVATAQDGPTQVGDEVSYIEPDGIIRGTIAVREVADPFTDFDPIYPPEEGMRYVVLTVTYQAALDQTFDALPDEIMLQTDDGSLLSPTYVPRPGEPTVPELEYQTLAPDNRISGVIGFALPEGAVIERVWYTPTSGRLLNLLELAPGTGPSPGDPSSVTDYEGVAAGSIAVEVMDPFSDFDPNYAPQEGKRYVALRPVVENVGQLPFYEDPYDLYLRDSGGFLYAPSNVYPAEGYALAPLESQTLSPGDRVSGLVSFAVPAGAQLTEVFYYPSYSSLITIADLVDGGAAPPAEPEPVVAASAPPAPSPEAVVVASPTPDPSAGIGR